MTHPPIRQHEETCDRLGPFLSHPDPKVRALAEWAMRQSGAVMLVTTSLEAGAQPKGGS